MHRDEARAPTDTKAGLGSRVAMRLTLSEGDRDVDIDASAAATVSDLVDALAEHTGTASAGVVFADRLGRLRLDDPLVRSGLLPGDVVSLIGPVPPRTPPRLGSGTPVVCLVVTGGPSAGLRIGLAAGNYEVGRDGAAKIVIADASLSRKHFRIRVAPSGAVAVADANSTNGTAVEGSRLAENEEHDLKPGEEVEAGRSTFTWQPWRRPDGSATRRRGAMIAFNRPPRVSRGYVPPTLRIDAPPAAARAIRIPLIVAIVPVFMGAALFLLTKSPMMLMMAVFSPLMVIGSSLSERRSGRREHSAQLGKFNAAVDQLRKQLTAARVEEQIERRAATPNAAELAARAIDHLPSLWERRPADKDYLDLRLGVADQPSIASVAFLPGGDSALRDGVETLIQDHAVVPVVPVHVRLAEVGALGVVGEPATAGAVARWIMVQLTTLQSPRDLVITAALSRERAEEWRWLGWLPHADHPASPLDGEHVVTGEHPAHELLKSVSALAKERRDGSAVRQRARRRTTVVVLVDEDVAPEATVVDELIDGCAEVDIVVVWLAQELRHLPGGCGVIVETSSERAVADVTWTTTGRTVAQASVDALAPAVAEAVARSLAPVEDTTAGGAAASVPRSVALLEILDLIEPTAADVAKRWAARSGRDLAAIVGTSADGPFSLDLRADGPHALVAGTTGAGKSELLQTMIASLAATHPPDRIAFLLVDYKGGAAFKDCVGLPHAVGMVTDLDGHQVQRALTSLNAELKRREHLLSATGTRDLIELERRDPGTAPPSLVIVIDEFATLAKEVPEFVDGVVDVAQRGRSLGVHVVLATQRPGNAVTENIRANTNLRVALRVAGAAESDDVIGSPDAAKLPRSVPGRAYARTGPTELELFQAGFVGGRTRSLHASKLIDVTDIVARSAPTTRGGTPIEETTDLQLLVAAIQDATVQSRIEPPSSPWLPALSESVGLFDLESDTSPGAVAVGITDEPRRQRQDPFVLDLPVDGNLLIFGAGGSGKTTALRTIAAALAREHEPSKLNLYGLDFAGRGLQALEGLPHCGSVIAGEEEELVSRLLSVLRRTIDARSRLFAEARVANLADYQRLQPDVALARIVVLLDSYAGFVETYERVDLGALVDALPRLVADGRAAGVHFVMTADRRAAVPASIASLIASRLILKMASDDDYQMLGVAARTVKGAVLPAGRGFLADGREVQIATVSNANDAATEAAAIAALAARLAGETEDRAPSITRLPSDIAAEDLVPAAEQLTATLGLDDADLAPVIAPLADSHFVVIGPYRSGRTTALDTIVAGLRDSTPDLRTHLLVTRRSWLADGDHWDSVTRGVDACEAHITALLDEVLGTPEADEAAPTLVVIDDAGGLIDSSAASSLEMLIKRGRDSRLRFLMSFETGEARHYSGWVKEIKKDGRGVLLEPNLDLDGELLGARLPRRSNPIFPPGRGYVVIDGRTTLAQVARRTPT